MRASEQQAPQVSEAGKEQAHKDLQRVLAHFTSAEELTGTAPAADEGNVDADDANIASNKVCGVASTYPHMQAAVQHLGTAAYQVLVGSVYINLSWLLVFNKTAVVWAIIWCWLRSCIWHSMLQIKTRALHLSTQATAWFFSTKELQQFVLVSQCNFHSRSLDSTDHRMMLQ